MIEDGHLPSDWKIKPLPEELQFLSGKAHEQHISELGQFVVVNSKFISSDGRVRKHSTHNFQPAKTGDILMVMSDLPNGKALAKTFLVDEDDRYAVNQRVCILRAKSGDPEYFRYQLNRAKYFLSFDDGVQQTHLLNRVFVECPVVVPPSVQEQKSIARVLSDMDALIASLDALIAKKRDVRLGASENIFTRRSRTECISEPWRPFALRHIGKLYGGLAGKSKEDFATGDARFVPFSNVVQNARLDPSWLEKVDIRSNETQNAVRNGDLLFNGSSETPEEVALASAVRGIPDDQSVYLNSFCFGFRPNRNADFCADFWAYLFRSSVGRSVVSGLAQGSTRYNISKKAFLQSEVLVPSVSEQRSIASTLTDMDAEIDSLIAKRAKLSALREGGSQQLLTGKIRLV